MRLCVGRDGSRTGHDCIDDELHVRRGNRNLVVRLTHCETHIRNLLLHACNFSLEFGQVTHARPLKLALQAHIDLRELDQGLGQGHKRGLKPQ
jgi:hypothetical protein